MIEEKKVKWAAEMLCENPLFKEIYAFAPTKTYERHTAPSFFCGECVSELKADGDKMDEYKKGGAAPVEETDLSYRRYLLRYRLGCSLKTVYVKKRRSRKNDGKGF